MQDPCKPQKMPVDSLNSDRNKSLKRYELQVSKPILFQSLNPGPSTDHITKSNLLRLMVPFFPVFDLNEPFIDQFPFEVVAAYKTHSFNKSTLPYQPSASCKRDFLQEASQIERSRHLTSGSA